MTLVKRIICLIGWHHYSREYLEYRYLRCKWCGHEDYPIFGDSRKPW